MNTPKKTYGSLSEFFDAPEEEQDQLLNEVLDGAIEDQRKVMREADKILAARKKAADAKARSSKPRTDKVRRESNREHSGVGLS